MGVVRHTLAFQKQFSVLNLQYVKTELSYDADFIVYGSTSIETTNWYRDLRG